MLLSVMHLKNVKPTIDESESGRSTLQSDLHLAKTFDSSVTTDEGIVTSFSPASLNALLPIIVTDEGIVMRLNMLQLSNE